MIISDFEQQVKAVYASRDKWINLIESRLKDLTGLRLSKDTYYCYLFDNNDDKKPIKRSGKDSIVAFPTDGIARALQTKSQFETWKFILSQYNLNKVFEECLDHEKCMLGDDANEQLEKIRREVLYADDGDFSISDILGVFSYQEHQIKLFAQVIAFYSILLNVESEDLTFVVLAHELAHAYTIAGYDIDGNRGVLINSPYHWNKYIIEGLAQYYTEAICSQLKNKYPQFSKTYETLLIGQTRPYTWHIDWCINFKSHEYIRNIMMNYRNSGNSDDFKNNLELSDTILLSIP